MQKEDLPPLPDPSSHVNGCQTTSAPGQQILTPFLVELVPTNSRNPFPEISGWGHVQLLFSFALIPSVAKDTPHCGAETSGYQEGAARDAEGTFWGLRCGVLLPPAGAPASSEREARSVAPHNHQQPCPPTTCSCPHPRLALSPAATARGSSEHSGLSFYCALLRP